MEKIICTLEELTDDKKQIHRHWSDGGETFTPVGEEGIGSLGFLGKEMQWRKIKIKEKKTIKNMTSGGRSLLLYFEDCEVNSNSLIDSRKMNRTDFNIAERWNEEGFVEFGRFSYTNLDKKKVLTHRVKLSEEAWKLAHQERKERAERIRKRFDKQCDER